MVIISSNSKNEKIWDQIFRPTDLVCGWAGDAQPKVKLPWPDVHFRCQHSCLTALGSNAVGSNHSIQCGRAETQISLKADPKLFLCCCLLCSCPCPCPQVLRKTTLNNHSESRSNGAVAADGLDVGDVGGALSGEADWLKWQRSRFRMWFLRSSGRVYIWLSMRGHRVHTSGAHTQPPEAALIERIAAR